METPIFHHRSQHHLCMGHNFRNGAQRETYYYRLEVNLKGLRRKLKLKTPAMAFALFADKAACLQPQAKDRDVAALFTIPKFKPQQIFRSCYNNNAIDDDDAFYPLPPAVERITSINTLNSIPRANTLKSIPQSTDDETDTAIEAPVPVPVDE
eukprot:Pgem_evm1s854